MDRCTRRPAGLCTPPRLRFRLRLVGSALPPSLSLQAKRPSFRQRQVAPAPMGFCPSDVRCLLRFPSPGPSRQGSRYDSATRLHADVRFATRCSLINSSSLSAAAFQPATGHSNQHILVGLSTLPEPESRYGLSLAHNDAFATIGRSMFLACTFVSTSKTFADPFDSRLFRSVRFSRPNRGDVNARNPFSAPFFDTPNSSPISTPLQAFFRKPSGSKRSTGSQTRKLVSPDVRLSLTPRCFFLRFHCG